MCSFYWLLNIRNGIFNFFIFVNLSPTFIIIYTIPKKIIPQKYSEDFNTMKKNYPDFKMKLK